MQNSPENKVCQSCGGTLVAAAEQNYCPACMLRNAMQPRDSELDALPLDLTQSMVIGASATNKITEAELAAGARFGDYRILRRLGRGGMGVVYEAEHMPTSRRMALKVMAHSLEDRQARARFLREGRLAASINHPNSVYVYATEEIDGHPTISMELVDGATLQHAVKARGPMPVRAAVDAILQVIDGLEAAHQVGVLHRDVKPNNCFVDSDGNVKIGDFGLSIATTGGDGSAFSQRTQTEITQVGSFLGTPAYASPEQLRGEPLDHRSDIYAVGVTLYFLLTGEVPFAAENMVQLLARVLDSTAPSIRARRSDLPVELDNIIARCLKKNSGDRFADYESLRNALLPFSSRVSTPSTLGIRFVAGAIDWTAYLLLVLPVALLNLQSSRMLSGAPLISLPSILGSAISLLGMVLYFTLSEWRFGKTIGKWALGLSVVQGESKPQLIPAFLRAAVFVGAPHSPGVAFALFQYRSGATYDSVWSVVPMMIVGWSGYIVQALLYVTARQSNGYAALYELLTDTRVIQAEAPPAKNARLTNESFEAAAGTEMVGPYYVLQAVGATDCGNLVLGYDAKLLRRVWIHRSSGAKPLITEADRNLTRPTRLRWLGGRVSEHESWDCFESLSGGSLSDVAPSELEWPLARVALAQLAGELQVASKEGSLPPVVTLQNLWVTDSGQIKLLPFAMSKSGNATTKGSANTPATVDLSMKPVELLRSIAQLFIERFNPIQIGNRAMSLSDRDDLAEVEQSGSVDEAQTAIKRIKSRRSISVKSRIAMMLAVTWAFPALSALSLLTISIVLSNQRAAMPEIAKLAEALRLREVVSTGVPDYVEKLNSIDNYIRANFRELYDDRSRMESLYGQTQLVGANMNSELVAIFAKPNPSPELVDQANREFLLIRAKESKTLALSHQFNALEPNLVFLWAIIGWLEFIWFPSLFTAIFFGGGLLLRAFGLTLVNRRAQRASRLRVLVRMFATGVFPMLVFVAGIWANLVLQTQPFPLQSGFQQAAIGLVILACMAVFLFRSRRRFFSDRIAGTYLVGM